MEGEDKEDSSGKQLAGTVEQQARGSTFQPKERTARPPLWSRGPPRGGSVTIPSAEPPEVTGPRTQKSPPQLAPEARPCAARTKRIPGPQPGPASHAAPVRWTDITGTSNAGADRGKESHPSACPPLPGAC
ncbi:hypothetical protein SKAU_G00105850 [Synaphobranchus kaupii]|uniref:Uncharacterized protein n=1 Tax=Synaphobranchus kaupii TaxID=118154 RepID=A0A9Q1FZQ0_SYNKA|nr:hypothetical protein SKAU_G00105850 [Synaphobranchus kaupii]